MSSKISGTFILLLMTFFAGAATADEAKLETPDILLTGVGFDVEATVPEDVNRAEIKLGERVLATSNESTISVTDIELDVTGTATLTLLADGIVVAERTLDVIPGWVSLFPPLFAILLAFLVRAVIPALFAGICVTGIGASAPS